MPTYEYACTACGHHFDAVQAFTDDPLTNCPQCDGRLRKVFGSVGVVFKGSGFYRTDSRSSSSASAPAHSKSHGSESSVSEKTSGAKETVGAGSGSRSAGSSTGTGSSSSAGAKAAAD